MGAKRIVSNAVKRNWKNEYIPKPPSDEYKSPLFTHFHKWDACEKKLSKDSIPTTINFNLQSNPYARKLTSELRQQTGSKGLVIPKDLLIRFSILKKPEDGSLWLIPFLKPMRTGAGSGYAPNSKAILENKNIKLGTFSPREIMANLSTMTGIKDLQWDKRTDLLVNKLYIDLLNEKFEQVKFKNEPVQPQSGDLVININEGEKFEVKDGITFVNISKFQFDSPNYDEFLKKLKSINNDQIIVNNHYKPFIDIFIKFIFYNK